MTSFLKMIDEFKALNALPAEVDFKGNGIAETFSRNRAKWHKSCHLKFAPPKLERVCESLAGKHTCSDEVPQKSKHQTTWNDNSACIFCSKRMVSYSVHQCSTMKLETDLRYVATELNDTNLLARISGGDIVTIEAKSHIECLVKYQKCTESSCYM